jgi:hypothetical protein
MAQAVTAPKTQERMVPRQENANNNVLLSSYGQKEKSAAVSPLIIPSPKIIPLPKDKPETNFNFENGPPMLSLFVADQNTAIGKRNIHLLKEGHRYSIGGGKSDFLIFLVPIPSQIAELEFDGRQCTIHISKPQYFPDIDSDKIPNCIGKTIRVVSDKGYELHIRIERYEDPLKALNKLLNSVSVPGNTGGTT